MLPRQLIVSVKLTALVAIVLGLAYPFAVYGIGQAAFRSKADGSLITQDGKVVGSALIGQRFLNDKGNPDPHYFQPRPSAAGDGYDAMASAASNLGPSNPLLVGFIPGLNTVDLNGNPSDTNPFATPDDPYCVPTDAESGDPIVSPTGGERYAKNRDGTYVCDPSTVPERTLAYRQFNSLPNTVKVPSDAVTASGSGLDPDISAANANLQAARVASARHLPRSVVMALIRRHTSNPQLGFLGEKVVNVLKLNLALDKLSS